MGHELERRRLLSRVGATLGVGATAGCLTGGGDPEADSGEQEALDDTGAGIDDGDGGGDADGGQDGDDGDIGGDDGDGDGDDGDGESRSGDGDGTDDGGDDGTEAGGQGEADVDFEAAVESIEKCGKTCRVLTYTLRNLGSDRAPDVTVTIRVFTGGEEIWVADQSVGDVDARSQRTGISRDIDVGVIDGQKIKDDDGDVVIELTPSGAGVSETFTFQRTLDV